MGVLIRIARLDIDANDAISPAGLARLNSIGENLFDMLQSMMLNWSVVFSLLLTIYISIAVLHSGAYAYVAAPERLFSGPQGAESHNAWSDLASFAWPDDDVAQASLRRGLYVAECVCVALGVVLCTIGMFISLIMYAAFGMALPDVLTKFEYMLNIPNHMGALWALSNGSILTLPLAVAFVAARASAVLSLAMFAAAGFVQLFGFFLSHHSSLAMQMESLNVSPDRCF